MATAERETAKYEHIWTVPAYRVKSHSLKLWQEHRDLFPAAFTSGIDIGCGLGRILPVWKDAGIDAWGVDLVPSVAVEPEILEAFEGHIYQSTLWEFSPDRMWDVGICTDVMEHIPTRYVEASLERMAQYCRRVVFKIANFNSQSLGQQLHLTQRDAEWWRSVLWGSMAGKVDQIPYPTDRPEYVFTWEAVP